MYQRAAGGRVEALDRLVHRLAAEPVLVIGPGRTDRLRAQQPAAAGNLLAFSDRRRRGIRDLVERCRRFSGQLPGQRRHRDRRRSGPRHAGNQRTWPQQAVAVGLRVGKNHRRRGQRQTGMHPLRKIEFDLGAGVRRAGRAQQFGRQQRVGTRRRRPEVVVHAHHPQRIEVEAGAFERAEHLDGGPAACLRLEDALPAELRQAAHRLVERQRAEQRIEPAEAVERLVESAAGLVFVTGEFAVAGPAGGFQHPAEGGGPGARALRFRCARQRCDKGFQRRDRLRTERRLLFGQASGQPDQRRQGREIGQIAAQRRIEPGAAIGFRFRRRPAAGQQ